MMHFTLKKLIGDTAYTFTFLGDTLHEVLMESQHLGFQDVYACGLCQSKKLYLRAMTTEKDKYEYVKVMCGNCRASLTFGKRKDDGAFFLRRHEDKSLAWEAHKEDAPKAQVTAQGTAQHDPFKPVAVDEDVPF